MMRNQNNLRDTNCQYMLSYQETEVRELHAPFLEEASIRLFVKREDQNHPEVSGNKWWKLKYNLQAAQEAGQQVLLTFGGAYSNHLYATAAAARACGFKSIGIIRGEETLPLNATLSFARECGMELVYVSRIIYREKNSPDFIKNLRARFGNFYLVPEGGSNALAIRGVKEFGERLLAIPFDYLCTPVGTGGTLAGLLAGLQGQRRVIGFPALKGGGFLYKDIEKLLSATDYGMFQNLQLETDYHFGGYGKVPRELLEFLDTFEAQHGFQLDPIYTGKMMAGIFDLIKKGLFKPGTTLLALHTGGLQGWNGIR